MVERDKSTNRMAEGKHTDIRTGFTISVSVAYRSLRSWVTCTLQVYTGANTRDYSERGGRVGQPVRSWMTSATKNPRLDYDALADEYASLAQDFDGGVENARQGDSPLRPRRQSDTATVTSSTLCPGVLDMSRSASTLLSDPEGTKDTSQPGQGSTSEMQAD